MIANTRKMYEFKLKVQEILDIEENLYRAIYYSIGLGRFDVDGLKKIRNIIENDEFLGRELLKISKQDLMDNQYLKDIKIHYATEDKFCLSNGRIIKPGIICVANANYRTDNLYPIRELFYSDDLLELPCIAEKDTAICWMSVEPFEINTFSSFANSAQGKILLGGCGLGYIAYLLSLKDSVTEITIVDNNQSIIELFKKHILPQFKNKDKIKIVEGDILEFMCNSDLSKYDEINLDVWRDYLDMIYTYLPALEIEFAHPNLKFSYWIEENLRYELGKCLMRIFAKGEVRDTIFDIIARDILENSDIKTPNEFKELVKLQDMRKILYHWYLDNKELTTKYEDREMKEIELFVKNSQEIINGQIKL